MSISVLVWPQFIEAIVAIRVPVARQAVRELQDRALAGAWLQRLERLRAVRGRAVHDTVVVPAARRLIVAGIRE